MSRLAPSTLHEYYLGDLPGTIQYSKNIEDIINLELPDDEVNAGDYRLCEHSYENLTRIIPHTKNINDWKIILIMKSEQNGTHLKAALMNRHNGKIALLTSTNFRNSGIGRATVKCIDDTWFLYRCRLTAPICFWKELKNRLLY